MRQVFARYQSTHLARIFNFIQIQTFRGKHSESKRLPVLKFIEFHIYPSIISPLPLLPYICTSQCIGSQEIFGIVYTNSLAPIICNKILLSSFEKVLGKFLYIILISVTKYVCIQRFIVIIIMFIIIIYHIFYNLFSVVSSTDIVKTSRQRVLVIYGLFESWREGILRGVFPLCSLHNVTLSPFVTAQP